MQEASKFSGGNLKTLINLKETMLQPQIASLEEDILMMTKAKKRISFKDEGAVLIQLQPTLWIRDRNIRKTAILQLIPIISNSNNIN